jgi:hypothetical protein
MGLLICLQVQINYFVVDLCGTCNSRDKTAVKQTKAFNGADGKSGVMKLAVELKCA